MRIGHLVIAGDVAGGQMVALRLLQAARRRGDEGFVIAPAPGPFVDLVRAEGLDVHFLDVNRTFRVGDAWRLARLLRRERADLLHTHTALAANVLSRIAGRIAGVPVISHLHIENHFRPQPLLRAPLRALDNWTARLAARHVAVSEDTRRAFVEQGYPAARVVTIYNGIELSAAASANGGRLRAELGVPADASLIGSVARLCAVKGQRELIEALGSLPGTRLLLVGDDLEEGGEYRRSLERDAARLGVSDRVVFTGPRGDVPAILEELDVFVLPSWTEGLPMTVLEAMAQGKPVVATPVGGTPELVVDGETGLLVPPRDPTRLAQAIRGLLADPDRAARLGRAGRERVGASFTAAEMERRVLALYDEVV